MADTITRTNVNLISGVPFTSDYRHTRWFTSLAQQTTWFNQRPKVKAYSTANFQRLEGRFFFDCDVNVESLNDVKYIYFNNADGVQKRYYGFVTRKEYINRHVTRVHFSLDVVQSFMFDMDFKPSYVVREHFERYNSSGLPISQTIDEGLDYGKEYQRKGAIHIKNQYNVKFLVIISKEQMHEDEADVPPSFIATPQPLYWYVIPFTPDGKACRLTATGGLANCSSPQALLNTLYRLESSVNNIVSMYVTEDIGLPISNITKSSSSNHEYDVVLNLNGSKLKQVSFADGDEMGGYGVFVERISEFKPTEFELSSMYWHSLVGNGNPLPDESKILMSPYHWIELQDYRGNTVKIRPEYIQGDKLIILRKGSLGLMNKVSYNVKHYNQVDGDSIYARQLENEDALIDNNPHDVTVRNDNLAAFLQGNRNQIANQRESIMLNASTGASQGLINTASGMANGNMFSAGSGAVSTVSSIGQGVLQIQGIQAKQDDISNIPANISKMGGNTAFDVGNGFTGIFVVYKGLKYEYQRTLENFFKAYGYKSNLFKVPNFRTRQHFNYVQTLQCVIQGSFSNDYLVQLQKIFDSGITLWHTDDIGNYSLSNNEL